MPGLPWVRLDSNIASHDKILSLLGERDGVKAAFMYVCGLGYCGGHGTDGLIRYGALPFIHGIRRLAELRVKHAQHVAPTIAHAKTLSARTPNRADRKISLRSSTRWIPTVAAAAATHAPGSGPARHDPATPIGPVLRCGRRSYGVSPRRIRHRRRRQPAAASLPVRVRQSERADIPTRSRQRVRRGPRIAALPGPFAAESRRRRARHRVATRCDTYRA